MPTKEEIEIENDRLKKELARLKRASPAAQAAGRAKAVSPDDIDDPEIRAALDQAQEVSDDHDDSTDAREPLAKKAQNLVLALRELNVGYVGHGVQLHTNPSFDTKLQHDGQKPKGDLFALGQPCHPRELADKLAEAVDVDELTRLCVELKEKLDYEATP
jgi:hypothetical protein